MKKFISARKKLLLLLCVPVLALAGVYGYSIWQLNHLNSQYHFQDIPGNLVGSFRAGPGNSMNPVSGNVVYFDLGSRHSFINRKSIERLREIGSPVEFSNTLIWSTDADGRYRLYTEKVKTDITIPNPELPDSLFVIHDVELLVVDDDKLNVFGMDIIRNLVVERLWPEGIINLYKEVPEGYHTVMKLHVHDSVFENYIGNTGRAAIDLVVNDSESREYFLDSGGNMVGIEVVQPEDQMHMATTKIEIDSVTGLYTQRQCRVSFGDRLRYSSVVYCDTLHTDKYSVNPMKLFDQDFVLDMPGRRLMIHKTRT